MVSLDYLVKPGELKKNSNLIGIKIADFIKVFVLTTFL